MLVAASSAGPSARAQAAFCEDPRGPTSSVWVPNVTKTLGGPSGWTTPFIVQNVGTASTDIEVRFHRVGVRNPGEGLIMACRTVTALAPGRSFADVPSNDSDLPADRQFSVLVRSFGSEVVVVVNQQAGAGDSQEADAYVGASSGAMTVFLPNVVRRFYGFHSPIIIQSTFIGQADTTLVTANFLSFDGTKSATITRTLCCGQSQFIEPNVEPALVDGTQYAVTLSASHPISALLNTHRDEGVSSPVMYSVTGIASDAGAATLYGPYAVKNVPGVGQGISTIVVQNLGTATVTPTLTFTALGGGASTMIGGQSTASGQSWVFDPRYIDGDTAKTLCGATASPGCLADGEYSFVAQASGQIAAQVNVIWQAPNGDVLSAAGYTAIGRPSARLYLPNVTRTLGGPTGWTTPFLVQSPAPANVKVSWYRFSDGSLVTTQNLAIAANTSQRIDPRGVPALADDTQYSVTLDGNGQRIAAIVSELNYSGGDGAMIYPGLPPFSWNGAGRGCADAPPSAPPCVTIRD